MVDFFYSDPHLGHSTILHGTKDQPFEREIRKVKFGWQNVKEMDEGIIDIFNSVVPKDATTTHLGDMFFYGRRWSEEALAKMNGKHILICGNHDHLPHKMMKLGFAYACCHATTMIAGHVVNLSHFQYADAMDDGNKYRHRALKYEEKWLIHGHVHSRWKTRPEFRMINASADANDFRPLSRDYLTKYIQTEEHKIKAVQACEEKKNNVFEQVTDLYIEDTKRHFLQNWFLKTCGLGMVVTPEDIKYQKLLAESEWNRRIGKLNGGNNG